MIGRAYQGLRSSAAAVSVAFENRDVARLQLAWAGMSFAIWSFTIALGVYAFDAGGATAVGIAGLVRLLPGALASPFAGVLGDRASRRVLLASSALAGAIVLGAAATAAALDSPPALTFAFAGLLMAVTSPYVPAEGALLPAVARSPQELSAANVAHSAMDNGGFLIGSVTAGLLLAPTSPAAVFAISATGALAAVALLARIPRDQRPDYVRHGGALGDVAVGARVLVADRGLTLLGTALTMLVLFEGAADVMVVIVALDLLGLGEGSVGYLNAAWGIGALAGGAALAFLLDRGKLAAGIALGSLAIGVATALPAALAVAVAGYVAWAGIGAGYTFVEVAARTLMQRLGSDETMSRVFGMLETARLAAMALGSIAVPALIALFGIRGALIVMAAALPVFVLARWRAIRSFEIGAPIAERTYALLRADPIFGPLPVATLERLSLDATAVDVDTGEEIITQGERGDRFFVIDSGEVEVFEDGAFRRTEGEGESFGEIALLRDVARTATVRASRPTRLWAIERDRFIAAVTGHDRSHQAARSVAERRLPIDQSRTGSQRQL